MKKEICICTEGGTTIESIAPGLAKLGIPPESTIVGVRTGSPLCLIDPKNGESQVVLNSRCNLFVLILDVPEPPRA